MPRKVLEAAGDSLGPVFFDPGGSVRDYQGRRLGKAPAVARNDRIVGIAVEIDHRGEVAVDPGLAQHPRSLTGGGVGRRGVMAGTKLSGAGGLGEAATAAETADLAAFLVDGDQQSATGRLLQGPGEILDLIRADDVVAVAFTGNKAVEEDDAT